MVISPKAAVAHSVTSEFRNTTVDVFAYPSAKDETHPTIYVKVTPVSAPPIPTHPADSGHKTPRDMAHLIDKLEGMGYKPGDVIYPFIPGRNDDGHLAIHPEAGFIIRLNEASDVKGEIDKITQAVRGLAQEEFLNPNEPITPTYAAYRRACVSSRPVTQPVR